ncbi:hypothetical protein ACHHYP_20047 [Achlya hypogyna]|uniref:RING-type domain-containing protein n=1 Tax=Achlya hypogyna TaxID=1202772 RepID=A0A1V9Z9U4_ACHHY|nr:hypothetical protein ACHHYP_20047 [Achlya hypogyna]
MSLRPSRRPRSLSAADCREAPPFLSRPKPSQPRSWASTQQLEQNACPICLDEFAAHVESVFTSECGHKFHFSCLLENVNHDEANATKCPVCRKVQTQWPERTTGLAKAHPWCTNCGARSCDAPYCGACGALLAHTPTAAERARQQASQGPSDNVVVECPTCCTRCMVSASEQGALLCPNGHLFALRMQSRRLSATASPRLSVQCMSCINRIRMPPGSQAGQYMCPCGQPFYYRP